MTVKSIVEVDLQAGEFSKFADLFNRYNEQLKKQPQLWQKISKEHTALASQFERVASGMRAQDEATERGRDDDERRLKDLTKTDKLWTSISRSSASLYRNVVGIGTGILKWGGILAGVGTVAAAGGLFGFDRLASDVAGTRQSAMGFGVSPAQLQAFSVHLSRFVDPNAYLGQVTTMETDISQRRAWYALMGGRAMTGDTTKDALSFLNAARAFAIRTPESQLGTLSSAYGLPFSVEQLMRMRGTGNAEWTQQIAGATKDVGAFGLTDRAALAAQNFTTAMAANRTRMMDQLWIALSRLTGPLTHLSTALTNAAVKVLGSPAVKQGIDSLAKWLQGFSGQVDTKAFTDSLKTFTADAIRVAGGISEIAGAMSKLGIGNLVAGAAGARVGAGIGSLFGPLGTVIGAAGGAALGVGTKEAVQHWDEIKAELMNIGNSYYQAAGALVGNYPATAGNAASGSSSIQVGPRQTVHLEITNATGGSAAVAINGLAGH